jgi:hypothetical protein
VIAQQLAGQVDVAATRLMTFTRTSMLSSYRGATLRTYSQQGDIADTWTWLAALSPQTCAACLAMSGQTFPISETFFPSHPNCRCVPVLNIRGLSPVVAPNSGVDYFDGLSPMLQDQILGKAGGHVYRNGDVALTDFIHVRDDAQWGRSLSQGSLTSALANAKKNERDAA